MPAIAFNFIAEISSIESSLTPSISIGLLISEYLCEIISILTSSMLPFKVFFEEKTNLKSNDTSRNSSISFVSKSFCVNKSKSIEILCPICKASDVPPAK